MNKFLRTAAIAALTTLAAPVFAAYPQAGLWMLDSELNGEPGRGMQIDWQQGRQVIVSYYGYRDDGSGLFYLATGEITDGKTLNADLIEFKNGPVIGSLPKTGEVSKVLGAMNIVFDSTTSGTITLPGEKPQKFSRYVYEDLIERINKQQFRYTSVSLDQFSQIDNSSIIRFEVQDPKDPTVGKKVTFDRFRPDGIKCSYDGDIKPKGNGFSSVGVMECIMDPNASTPKFYKFDDLNVDERGFLTGILYESTNADVSSPVARKLFGACFKGADSGPAAGGMNRCRADHLGMD